MISTVLMMVIVKTAIEIAKIAFRVAKRGNRFTSGESTFIKRFPPNYRPYVKDVLTGAGIVIHGGLVADILKSEFMPETDIGIPAKSQTYKFNKKYYPNRRRYSRSRNKRYSNSFGSRQSSACNCHPCC